VFFTNQETGWDDGNSLNSTFLHFRVQLTGRLGGEGAGLSPLLLWLPDPILM